jgi:hypothetical protein
LPIVLHSGAYFLLPAKSERYVLSEMKIKGTTISPTLSIDLMSIITVLSLSISPYL